MTIASDAPRIIARASAIAAFAVTLVGFVVYPRPWGSHWSPEKIIAVKTIDLGTTAALISLVFCIAVNLVDVILLRWPKGAAGLRIAVYLDLASLTMAVMTPAT